MAEQRSPRPSALVKDDGLQRARTRPLDEQGRLQLEPKKQINEKLGEGRSTDALDSIALTVALEFPMLVDEGAAERMRERRRRYDEDPYSLAGANDYDPIATWR